MTHGIYSNVQRQDESKASHFYLDRFVTHRLNIGTGTGSSHTQAITNHNQNQLGSLSYDAGGQCWR